MKKNRILAALLAAGLCLTACSQAEQKISKAELYPKQETENTASIPEYVSLTDAESMFSKRDLSGRYDETESEKIIFSDSGAASESSSVDINQGTATITAEGTYIVSGSTKNGRIIIDADSKDKVQLVLKGADITSEASAAIYVRQAHKVFITLADGTENILANGGRFEETDDNNADAVIFSKDKLTLNGTGKLTVSSPAGNGIVSKSKLVIASGIYNITAASHGLSGKDCVAIADGSFDITAGKDGIHSSNKQDYTSGVVYIENGSFELAVDSDGISAMNEINIAGGSLNISRSYEGFEARMINISGGTVNITSSDDGLNAADKRIASNTGINKNGIIRGNDIQEAAIINISGGIIKIDAEGDGADTNGYMTVSGGELYVLGSSGGGDGALDYGISATINGGIVVAAGQSAMAVNFCEGSTQGAILNNIRSVQQPGTEVILLDSAGNEIIRHIIEKRYNSVVVSSPEIVDGEEYILKMGSDETDIKMDGLIYGRGFKPGRGHLKPSPPPFQG